MTSQTIFPIEDLQHYQQAYKNGFEHGYKLAAQKFESSIRRLSRVPNIEGSVNDLAKKVHEQLCKSCNQPFTSYVCQHKKYCSRLCAQTDAKLGRPKKEDREVLFIIPEEEVVEIPPEIPDEEPLEQFRIISSDHLPTTAIPTRKFHFEEKKERIKALSQW